MQYLPFHFARLHRRFRLLSTQSLAVLAVGFCIAIAAIFLYLNYGHEAAASNWHVDDNQYRKSITVTNNTSDQTSVYVALTIDTSDTNRFQADGGDIRFIKTNGEILPYYISSGIGTTATVIHVFYDTLKSGAQDMYMYYGNSTLINGFTSAFATQASSYSMGTPATEEKSTGPAGWWKFDQIAAGTVAHDSSINLNHGTLGGTITGATNPTSTIRQEINMINTTLTGVNQTVSSDARIQLDTTKYSGTVAYYFEVVGSASASSSGNMYLRRVGTTSNDATIAISTLGTSATRSRSSSFSPPAGATEYFLYAEAAGVGKTVSIKAARIIVTQTNQGISNTETQIEIGNHELAKTNTTTAPLNAPKYWKYDSASWSPAPTFYAEVTYQKIDTGTSSFTTSFTAVGTTVWTAPSGILSAYVDAWGGGGAGGAATGNPAAGGGGAGGTYIRKTLSLSAGVGYTVNVGAGGTSSSTTAGAGLASWFNTTGTAFAQGGTAGANATTAIASAAGSGSTATSIGDIRYAGGNGGVGSTAASSGGGGGGAGTTGDGGNASGSTRGTGTSLSGGNGGSGVASGVGATGAPYGGGGSGGRATNNTDRAGGAGGQGRVDITYTLANTAPTVTIILQEDNGSFGGWTNVTNGTIVNASTTSGTVVRARSAAFTPTTGRHYRIVSAISTSTGTSYDIYNAKIIAQQSSTISKFEGQYLLLNTGATSTGRQGYPTLWSTSEWAGVGNTYRYAHNASNSADSSKLQDLDNGNADITNATVTGSTAQYSSSFTMPTTGHNLDVNVTALSGTVAAGQILVQSNLPEITGSEDTPGTAVKIDDPGDPGSIYAQGRQVVRTSTGTLYSWINDGGSCEIWKSTDGSTWTEQDSTNNPTCSFTSFREPVAMAIDSTNTIHLAYISGSTMVYNTFSNDQFGTPTNARNAGVNNHVNDISISIDSSNIPHILFQEDINTSQYSVMYINRAGGTWNSTPVTIESEVLGIPFSELDMTINEDNIPEIAYIQNLDVDLSAAIGNSNYATSFTVQDLDITIPNSSSNNDGTSIGVDSSGNTWITYVDDGTGANDYISLIKHNDADAWTTWQTTINNSNLGKEPSLAINGTNVYVFYQDDLDDIVYDRYDGSSWHGETAINAGTYQDSKSRWSLNNNASYSTYGLDYLFTDGTDVYFNKLTLGSSDITTTSPDWKTTEYCISDNCLYYDGSDDSVVIANTNNIDLDGALANGFQFSFWVKPNTLGQGNTGKIFTKGDNTYASLSAGSSTATANLNISIGLTTSDATLTIADGLTLNKWQFVSFGYTDDSDDEITVYIDGVQRGVSTNGSGAPDADTSQLVIGGQGSTNFHGYIDEFKVNRQERTAAQVKTDFLLNTTPQGAAASLGQVRGAFLGSDLAGYWKLDETSGSATDSSGNGITLTNNGTTTYSAGKFGNASTHNGTSQYLSTTTSIPGIQTMSFWVYTSSASNNYVQLNGSAYLTSTSGTLTATGFSSPSVYVNGILNGTITALTWNHVTVTTTSAITASALELGRANGSYILNGSKLDEVRLYKRVLSPTEISSLYQYAAGPLAHWNFDQGTGTTTLSDVSGNGKSATITGMAETDWTAGRHGQALQFDGTDYITRADDSDFDFTATQNFTIMAWIKKRAMAIGNAHVIMSKAETTNGGWKLRIDDPDPTSNICLQIDDDATWTPDDSVCTSGTNYDDNTWHHVAVTMTGTSKIELYVDGVLKNTDTSILANTGLDNTAALEIGRDSELSSNIFTGVIDDVKIYNYARTSAQIVEDMNAGHPIGGSPVGSQAGYYKFDEGYGTRLNNSGSSGIGTTGTLGAGTSVPSWTNDGKFSKALSFDGTDDLVNMGSPEALDNLFDSGGTITAWVYPRSAGEGSLGRIVDKATDTNASGGYAWQMDSATSLRFERGFTTQKGAWTIPTGSLTANAWNHIALTYIESSTANAPTMYVNGQKMRITTATTPSGTAASDASQTLYIGNRPDTTRTFDGKIDEMKFYDTVLNNSQVLIDYNQGKAISFGTLSTGVGGTASDSSSSREYCVPGDTSSCSSPLVEWKLNENTGTSTSNDTSGNGLNGTFIGTPSEANWVPGKFGSAYSFNGTDLFLDKSDNNLLDLTNQVTLSAWFNSSVSYTAGGDIGVARKDGAYSLLVANNGKLKGVGTGCTGVFGTTVLSPNTWYFGAWTYDGTTNKIYLNGVLENTSTESCTFPNSLSSFQIAQGSQKFKGPIDEVRLYNYPRTAAQIAWEYNRGAPAAWYKLDECQGATAYNSALNGNGLAAGSNGTITIGASGTNTSLGTCTGSAGQAWKDGATGKINASLEFDGTDDNIAITNTAFAVGTRDFSYSVWMKPTNASSTNNRIFSAGGNAFTYELWLDSTQQIVAHAGDASAARSTAASNQLLSAGTWYHIAAVYDRDVGLYLYVNGALEKIQTGITSYSAVNYSSSTGEIGGYSGSSSFNFDGAVDDFRFYTYTLTPAQIKEIYNNGAVSFR